MRRTSGALRSRRSRGTASGAAALLVGVLAAAPAGSTTTTTSTTSTTSTSTTSTTSSPTGYAVGITRCTFVDRTRSTVNYSVTPPSLLANHRVLITEIRYPTAAPSTGHVESPGAVPAHTPGGFPMVVFAHGYDVTPDTYASLLDTWVRSGFVVAAPFFPEESRDAVAAQNNADTEPDLSNEPADLAFVTRQILVANATSTPHCPLVHGLVLASALALAGHSDGGTAVGMLASATGTDPQGTSYGQLRAEFAYRAVIVMSAQEDGVSSYRSTPSDPALLVVQSARDRCNRASGAVRLYRDVHQGDKWFLELLRAHHLPPFDGEDPSAFQMVAGVTTRFLQATVGDVSAQTSIMTVGNARPALARTFHAGRGPTIAPLTSPPLCGLH